MAVGLRKRGRGSTAKGEGDYLNTRLECAKDGGWSVAQQLGMARFARVGCAEFGTEACRACRLARYIPRQDCNPPDECVRCQERERCPCGSAVYRERLLGG